MVAVLRRRREHAAQRLRRTEQAGALEGDDDLGVVAVGELRQRVELQDRDERRVGFALLDRRVDLGDRLRPAFGFEDRGLPVAFGAQDRGLPLALRLAHRCLRVTFGDVDRGLLQSFRLEDLGPLLLVGLLLQREGLEDLRRRARSR